MSFSMIVFLSVSDLTVQMTIATPVNFAPTVGDDITLSCRVTANPQFTYPIWWNPRSQQISERINGKID